ncbi:MAG: sensor domain-containing diguanylate cyclase [Candidatus Manganitrophaceae bacterium]
MKKIVKEKKKTSRATELQTGLLQENTLLKRALRQKTKELSYFIDVGKALTSTLELKKILRVIMGTAQKMVRCDAWSLLLNDGEREEFYFELAKGISTGSMKRVRYKSSEGPIGWVAQKGVPLVINDFSKETRFHRRDFFPHTGAKSVLSVPILSKKRVIGILQMINRNTRKPFEQYDLDLLMKLVDQAALAIERSSLYQKMSDLATTDDLTRLYNFRFLDQALSIEIKRSQRYGSSLSLIFLDMDHFKLVNDQHGHLMGSQVLIEVAHLLRKSLREIDIIARYGGDEFVVVLPETDAGAASRLAQRIRNTLRSHEFLKKEGLSLHLSASFGIAGFPEHAKNKTDLIRLADQAMYKAKVMGRDKVYLA